MKKKEETNKTEEYPILGDSHRAHPIINVSQQHTQFFEPLTEIRERYILWRYFIFISCAHQCHGICTASVCTCARTYVLQCTCVSAPAQHLPIRPCVCTVSWKPISVVAFKFIFFFRNTHRYV